MIRAITEFKGGHEKFRFTTECFMPQLCSRCDPVSYYFERTFERLLQLVGPNEL